MNEWNDQLGLRRTSTYRTVLVPTSAVPVPNRIIIIIIIIIIFERHSTSTVVYRTVRLLLAIEDIVYRNSN